MTPPLLAQRPADEATPPPAEAAPVRRPAQLTLTTARDSAGSDAGVRERPAPSRRRSARRRRLLPPGLRRAIGAVLGTAVLVIAVGAATLGAAQALGAIRLATVLTGSMAPGIPTGSIVLDTPTPVSQIAPGDVITFVAPEPYTRVVTHRIVEIDRSSGDSIVVTRGDANDTVDPWRAKLNGDTVWEVRGSVPHVGSVLASVRSQSLRMIWSVLVPIAFGVSLTISIWRSGPAAPTPTTPAPTTRRARREARHARHRTRSRRSRQAAR
jgi:signal peptidase I